MGLFSIKGFLSPCFVSGRGRGMGVGRGRESKKAEKCETVV